MDEGENGRGCGDLASRRVQRGDASHTRPRETASDWLCYACLGRARLMQTAHAG
jgi:hypothetical protein